MQADFCSAKILLFYRGFHKLLNLPMVKPLQHENWIEPVLASELLCLQTVTVIVQTDTLLANTRAIFLLDNSLRIACSFLYYSNRTDINANLWKWVANQFIVFIRNEHYELLLLSSASGIYVNKCIESRLRLCWQLICG